MDRYYTFMLVPERDKKIYSFRVPTLLLRSLSFLLVVLLVTIVVLVYDYKQVLNQVYENRHLNLENQKLRDQLNIFQMKINTLADDIQRIHTFEQKLRIITGIDESLYNTQKNLFGNRKGLEAPPSGAVMGTEREAETAIPNTVPSAKTKEAIQNANPSGSEGGQGGPERELDAKVNTLKASPKQQISTDDLVKRLPGEGEIPFERDPSEASNQNAKLSRLQRPLDEEMFKINFDFENLEEKPEFQHLKSLYYDQLVQSFGIPSNSLYSKAWFRLSKQSVVLSDSFAHFDYRYNVLKSSIKALEINIHELDEFLLDQESFLKSTPTILPTRGWVTSYYGVRKSPHSGRFKIHEGLDIGGQTGTPIIAPADGIVTYAGQKPGFGKYLQIDHGYGVETIYGHNNSVKAVYGQKVKRGDFIATVGNTGLSTGPHLHYEVRVNGIPVDPLYFILD